jgi:hypothetical protein
VLTAVFPAYWNPNRQVILDNRKATAAAVLARHRRLEEAAEGRAAGTLAGVDDMT